MTDIIPKRIIQTYIDERHLQQFLDKGMPQTFQKLNPDFEIIRYSNDAQEEFVKNEIPEFYNTFLQLPMKINKSDFFRLCAIYKYGGFYFDLDVECKKSLEPLLIHNLIFPVEELLSQEIFLKEKEKGRYKGFTNTKKIFARMGQYGFAAYKNHPFILTMIKDIVNDIDDIIDSFQNECNKEDSEYEYWIYNTTATDRANRSIHTHNPHDLYKLMYPNPSIRNHDKWMYPLYFGEYAVHWCSGVWKKDKTK